MARCSENTKQAFFSSLLFSGLGLFSYFLLINFSQLARHSNDKLTSPVAYLFAVVAFNFLGFTIIKLSRWIDSISFPYSLRKYRLAVTYSSVAAILLIINYATLISAKLLINASDPFFISDGGHRVLIAVWLIELVVMSLLLANRSAKQSIELQREAARLQQENDNAKYEALQNQLNPHFLFNSLNTLVSEIEYNPASAVRFTRELSDVYRYVLQCQQQRTIGLTDEITFLESYIYLHRVRMGDCIRIDNRVGKPIDDVKIAPLSLQLLAENVIKHNTINEERPIDIILEITADRSYLIVSNHFRPKLSECAIGIGLKNLSTRYLLLCGKGIEAKCDETKSFFEVKIPLIYE